MFFPDLTIYSYSIVESDRPALNVGWLDAGHDFNTGHPPIGFLERLRGFSRHTVKHMRGFHVCPFCADLHDLARQNEELSAACHEDGRFSSAEIRVAGVDGCVYAAPKMILHYVETHGYLPPRDFVDAVMQSSGVKPDDVV